MLYILLVGIDLVKCKDFPKFDVFSKYPPLFTNSRCFSMVMCSEDTINGIILPSSFMVQPGMRQ